MPLAAGTRVGPYEIVAPLGAGGMGEVYRGRDPRLGREVAIKILPGEFSADPERLRRFEQEARAAAALNHPNILAVYDIGQHDRSPYIVSELLEGETLRTRLQPGSSNTGSASLPSTERPLPVRRAVEYALQIARGLAAAHDKGIVHRDLKPENIFLTVDGRAKILDFGLAKLAEADSIAGGTMLPTVVSATQPGLVLGTIGYMSPEQVRGQPADHRADIFAFGAILHEMLSGERTFRGESGAETLAAILKEDAPDLPLAERRISPALARVVDRCLEKNPQARFQSTHDLAFALEGLSTQSDTGAAAVPRGKRRPRWVPWALTGATALALALTSILLTYSRSGTNARLVRFEVGLPGHVDSIPTANFLAMSPDGTRLALVAANAEGVRMLWIRSLESIELHQLPGTENASRPFWSSDSRFIAFFADGRLKKVAINGGPPQTVCEFPRVATGGAWNQNGVILVSTVGGGPVLRVSASGGTPAPATTLDRSRQEEVHLFPHFLPDGRRFLYYARGTKLEENGTYVKSLDADDARLAVPVRSNFAYVEPGYLIYAHEGVLMAQPFDAGRAEATSEPLPIAEQVEQYPEIGMAMFSVSQTGVLVYRSSAGAATSRLLWFDRNGKQLGMLAEPALYSNPRLSPDGTRVAVELVDRSGNRDVWLIDVARGALTRFTFDAGRDVSPVWAPDGSRIAWLGNAHVYVRPSNGAGREESLYNEPWIPDDWIPDGSALLYHPNSPRQVWMLPLDGPDRTPRPVIETRSITTHARVSPDGRWVAFASNESGRMEIYVQGLPTPAGRWQVSTTGGVQPKWRHDGKELFYVALDGTLMAVPVALGTAIELGNPKPLFRTNLETTTGMIWHQYDVTRDGQRFLINTRESASTSPLTVILDWPALLRH